MVAGIIVTAAGDELVLAHPGGHVSAAAAWVLVGGPALFLIGGLLFKYSVFRVVSPARATGLGLLAVAAAASPWATPLSLSAGVTAVLALVGGWETWSRVRRAAQGLEQYPARTAS